jgi:hypothetical protein
MLGYRTIFSNGGQNVHCHKTQSITPPPSPKTHYVGLYNSRMVTLDVPR